MMLRSILSVFVVVAALAAGYNALATSEADIVFPIEELGGCEDKQSCQIYCDDSSHIEECLAFAERHNLIPPQELEKAKRFRDLGAVGPGGCSSERECEAYCENINNIQECLAFAEQHGFMDEEELVEAKKIQAALQSGVQFPAGCASKSSCEAYCSAPENMRECIAFAEAAGIMSERELKEAKQVLKALDAGLSLPGGCRSENECEAYCEDPAHMEECVEFGIAAGFIPSEEAEETRRMMILMREGKMPGPCREGREVCEAYCSDPANVEECTIFFIEAGFMTQEEAEIFRKTGGRGPGGCRGEECDTFCNDPANQEECFEFAREHGLIPEEELENIKEGVERFKEGISDAPPEVAQCLKDRIGDEVLAKIEAGILLPNHEVGDYMRECFELQIQIVESKMRSCLSLSCEEFFACMDEFNRGFPSPQEGKREYEEAEGPGPDSGIQQEIQARYEACFREQGESFEEREFGPSGGFGEGITPEQQGCIERILSEGNFQGPPPPEAEARIGQECFGGEGGDFEQRNDSERPRPQQFDRPHDVEQEAFPSDFEGLSPEELEKRFREEGERFLQEEELRRQEFEREFQQEQEQFQQFLSPDAREAESDRQNIEQHEEELAPPPGGSVMEAFLYLLRPLIPR